MTIFANTNHQLLTVTLHNSKKQVMKIVPLQHKDINPIVELWYSASLKAHHFIDSSYWTKHKESMRIIYLTNSETYVAKQNQQIVGFISMVDEYLAAIFVDIKTQRRGVGSKLLHHIMTKRQHINL